nr:unnamed protein product [Digitaria exilis]
MRHRGAVQGPGNREPVAMEGGRARSQWRAIGRRGNGERQGSPEGGRAQRSMEGGGREGWRVAAATSEGRGAGAGGRRSARISRDFASRGLA